MATIEQIVRYGRTIPYTPGSAVAQGEIVDLGTFVAHAPHAIAANERGELDAGWESTTVRVAKFTDDEVAQGVKMYWDAGTSTATITSGYSEGIFGYAAEAAAAGDATVDIKMAPA